MAARLLKHHQDDVRSKIQASQLVNRLTNHALGDLKLSNTQIRAIEILLKKTIPDLSSITLENGEDEHGNKAGFQVIHRTIVDPKA